MGTIKVKNPGAPPLEFHVTGDDGVDPYKPLYLIQWIRPEDKLPDDYDVLVTYRSQFDNSIRVAMAHYGKDLFHSNNHGQLVFMEIDCDGYDTNFSDFYNDYRNLFPDNDTVIAWAALPPPFRP